MTDRKKPSKLEWTTEDDHNGNPLHYIKIGRFELVVQEHGRRDCQWFVNNNDKDDDIFWQGFIEGAESSLKKAKKAALKSMADLLKDFKNYEKELKKINT